MKTGPGLMPGSAEFVQRMVHAIDAGPAAAWIRRGLALVGIIAIAVIFMYNFRGLATSQAMDQAQIGRSLATGHGWHSNYARPVAIGQLQSHGKNVAQRIWTDTANAPLPPLVDAIALFPIKSHLKPQQREPVYAGDRAIAMMAILLFLGSIVIQFFIARRLFDRFVAVLACTLVVLCDMMWQYAVSGLPQMLLLFLFNATLYVLVRAVEAQYRGEGVRPWLAAVGAGFGLLALSHGLTIWIFLGALIFIAFFFRPRGWAALIVLSVFLVLYAPWLIRTWIICGNPAGLALYTVLDGVNQSAIAWLRQSNFTPAGLGPAAFRDKAITNVIAQTGRIYDYLGWSVVAMMFFPSALHVFRRTETSAVRWLLFAMWGGAVLGMAVFGVSEEQGVAANQLHLLFLPIMTCYGLAWLLVQWRRLGIQLQLARTAFIVLLFLFCAFPMINTLYGMLLGPSRGLLRWPPYVPPYIAVLNDWMAPSEITASDMPWAIAWYADRRSILVPETVKGLTDLGDYGVLGGPIPALYLTPISGADNKFRDIMRGDYHEWAAVIMQSADVSKLPFKWGTVALGPDKECTFLADRDRSHPAP
jgi:hypothetical protein